jgi:hypothetical protein
MRSRAFSTAVLAAVMAVAVAAPAAAQIIHGKLLAEGLNTPIDGATIQLLDAGGRELPRVLQTNAAGTFWLRVEPGRYKLRIRRIGYDSLVTPLINVKVNDVYEGVYRVSPVAVRLATERITARPNLEWGRDGWARRRDLGLGGVFLSRPDLAEKDQRDIAWLFRDVPGIQVLGDGQVKSTEGYRCLFFKMNGVPVPFNNRYVPGADLYPTLQEMVPTGHDVMGLEIYREFKEVPPEHRMDAWPTGTERERLSPPVAPGVVMPYGKTASDRRMDVPCGLIVVWTRAAW